MTLLIYGLKNCDTCRKALKAIAHDRSIDVHRQLKVADYQEQLMHLQYKEVVAGHCMQIGVQAVDHHDAGIVVFHGAAHGMGELAGR